MLQSSTEPASLPRGNATGTPVASPTLVINSLKTLQEISERLVYKQLEIYFKQWQTKMHVSSTPDTNIGNSESFSGDNSGTLRCTSCAPFSSYHIITSSVIYKWIDAWQHGISFSHKNPTFLVIRTFQNKCLYVTTVDSVSLKVTNTELKIKSNKLRVIVYWSQQKNNHWDAANLLCKVNSSGLSVCSIAKMAHCNPWLWFKLCHLNQVFS